MTWEQPDDASRDFLAFARSRLEDTRILCAPEDTEPFARDTRGLYGGRVICAAAPALVADVSRILAYCNENGVAIIPQGGNTSSSGGSVPTPDRAAIILLMYRLNRIHCVDPIGGTVVVEAGVTLGRLKEHLHGLGFDFPLAIGSEGTCQIGGNIATNAGGHTVLRHGMMRDSVMGLQVVLPNGDIVDNLHALRKVRLGYELNGLFIGSEGTLGVVTGAVLKVRDLPQDSATAWLACNSLEAVMEVLSQCRARFGDSLESYETMSRRLREVVGAHFPRMRDPVTSDDYEWAVLVELQGRTPPGELTGALEEALARILDSGLAQDAIIATNESQRASFWAFRDGYQEATGRYGWEIVYDSSVPLAVLPEFAATVARRAAERFPAAEFIAGGHAGDGNIHVGFIFRREAIATREEYDRIEQELNRIVFGTAHALGGVFASEHPIGAHHVATLENYASPVNMDLMRQLKRLFDPNEILNPGKVLRAAERR